MVSIIRPGMFRWASAAQGYDARSSGAGWCWEETEGTTGITPRGCAAAGNTTKCISDGRAAAAHLTQARFLRTISFGISLNDKGEKRHEARIPKHREFIINLAEDYEKKDECWDKLQEIMEAYKKRKIRLYAHVHRTTRIR